MNPYDFVRIDVNKPPERRKPVWHHQFTGPNGQRLFTGHLTVEVYTETPLFIFDPHSTTNTKQSLRNRQGDYIIPGSSLKGMLRSVVETLGSGCLTLFDGRRDQIPPHFEHCSDNTKLCLACRIFGMLKVRNRGQDSEQEEENPQGVFLGKVNIGDASLPAATALRHSPMVLAALMGPKPHHTDFYLDAAYRYIAGRKYYFHHYPSGKGGNSRFEKYIQPLDTGNTLSFRIDFSNLEEDEFGALLLAVTLEEGMRHKIGYAKPLGLGSVQLTLKDATLVDYAARYALNGSAERGKMSYPDAAALKALRDMYVPNFSHTYLVPLAMGDLRRIWQWPPAPGVTYHYPSKDDWFDTPLSRGKRIAQTP